MTKIVYNTNYLGIFLSRDAVLRARELSGNQTWGGACIKGEVKSNGSGICDDDWSGIYNVSRNHAYPLDTHAY